MTGWIETKVVAFVRAVAGRYKNCYHRVDAYCRGCYSRAAADLLVEIKKTAGEGQPRPDRSLPSRIARIRSQLLASSRPVRSSEIDLPDVSPQLKHWTLSRMVRLGFIVKRLVQRHPVRYSYTITTKKRRRT